MLKLRCQNFKVYVDIEQLGITLLDSDMHVVLIIAAIYNPQKNKIKEKRK